MPFTIVRNDIACMQVDAIVNTANPRPVIGWGTDSRIHEAAGPRLLKQADAGFTETLLKRIDQTGKKDSEIYKKANLSKQLFSKIRNDPQYRLKSPPPWPWPWLWSWIWRKPRI